MFIPVKNINISTKHTCIPSTYSNTRTPAPKLANKTAKMKYKLSNIVIPLSRPSRHDSCNNKLAGPIGSQEDPHTTLSHAVSSAL
jgi:hypothetical protein